MQEFFVSKAEDSDFANVCTTKSLCPIYVPIKYAYVQNCKLRRASYCLPVGVFGLVEGVAERKSSGAGRKFKKVTFERTF